MQGHASKSLPSNYISSIQESYTNTTCRRYTGPRTTDIIDELPQEDARDIVADSTAYYEP